MCQWRLRLFSIWRERNLFSFGNFCAEICRRVNIFINDRTRPAALRDVDDRLRGGMADVGPGFVRLARLMRADEKIRRVSENVIGRERLVPEHIERGARG